MYAMRIKPSVVVESTDATKLDVTLRLQAEGDGFNRVDLEQFRRDRMRAVSSPRDEPGRPAQWALWAKQRGFRGKAAIVAKIRFRNSPDGEALYQLAAEGRLTWAVEMLQGVGELLKIQILEPGDEPAT